VNRADTAVVIPCLDLGATVGEAVASALRQTRLPSRIVVVDDGSTDPETLHVLAGIAGDSVEVLRLPHRGLAAARNAGVRATTADYLVTLDADDVLDPAYIEETARRLDVDPELAFVTTGVEAFAGAAYVWTPPAPTVLAVLEGWGPHPASLFRRTQWEGLGGFAEDLPLGLLEDLDFWLRALDHGFRGTVVPEPLLRYRVRRDSVHQRAAASDDHRQSMVALLHRHTAMVERLGTELLLAKERQVESMRQHRRHLEHGRAALVQELRALQAQAQIARAALRERGEPAVDFGDLGRPRPLSAVWGLERGLPLDRHYIEAFLHQHAGDVRGRVLEVKDPGYTRMFGGDRVTGSDVLDVDRGNRQATIVADLAAADAIPAERFDCFILTQTLHVIYEVRAALAHAVRILKPGGVLLCTLPVASRMNCEGPDYWRFTAAAAWRLFAEILPAENVQVTAYGNLLASTAFLHGLAADELAAGDLDRLDPAFPLLLAVRAVKPQAPGERFVAPRTPASLASREPAPVGVILAYHRVTDRRGALCLSPREFRAQMEQLAREWRPLPLGELARAAAAGEVPLGAVAVTFDDGYLDTLTGAAPILRELGIPATVFLTSDRLADAGEHWWDVLERIFLGGEALPPRLALDAVDALGTLATVDALDAVHVLDGRAWFATATGPERRATFAALEAACFEATLERRERLLGKVAAWSGLELRPRPSHRALGAAEVRRLAEVPGIAVGCHSAHHLWLPLQPPDVQRREVAEGRAALEALLQHPVRSFAYPYGEAVPETVAAVRAAGFEAGVTIRPAPVRVGADPLLLPRYEVRADAAVPLAARLRQAVLDRST
jgi:peptidoglycan/xylan/chitin deacetylase (PgdA/CDA1 family)/GT2 family glycosyltransferase